MKTVSISFLALMVLTIGACGVSKKASTEVVATTPAVPTTAPTRIAPSVASTDGIFAPGSAELAALQAKDKEVTMPVLQAGYKLYTGVCTNCHLPKSIYDRAVAAWPGILNSMAVEAKINDAQKDAIYKYVLSIKATQPR